MINKTAQKTIRKLIELALKKDGNLVIKNEPYTDLSIEVQKDYVSKGVHRVFLSHTSELNGDLMSDQLIEFVVTDDFIKPMSFTNDYMAYYIDESHYGFQKEVCDFVNMWAKNIREQGFFEMAKKQDTFLIG